MKTENRKLDLMKTGIFNDTELEKVGNYVNDNRPIQDNLFKSWEYYLIIHLSNADLYYLDEDTQKNYNNADLILDTEKGRIYCFK